jgi:cephalosporin hydroxylase
MDVSKDGDVSRALGDTIYDVILDDSSHEYDHQIRIIKEALPSVKSGGYMIVEDVFRNIPESDFVRDLQDVLPACSEAYFVVCNHEERYSPGWNNDKILVLVKS